MFSKFVWCIVSGIVSSVAKIQFTAVRRHLSDYGGAGGEARESGPETGPKAGRKQRSNREKWGAEGEGNGAGEHIHRAEGVDG